MRGVRGGDDASERVPQLFQHGANLVVGAGACVGGVRRHKCFAELALPVIAAEVCIHIGILDDCPGLDQGLLRRKNAWICRCGKPEAARKQVRIVDL